MFGYLLAYLDRANLSIAKLQMQRDLGFTDSVIGFGAGIFFVGYFLLEVPGTLLVERWSARKWLARIMISWGFIAALSGLIGTGLFGSLGLKTQFYVLRFLLGAAEAGFFPGIIVYLSHWFRFEDRSRAKAYFMVTQPLSLTIGLPLSRWIMETAHWGNLAGWRWLFLLEGIPPIILGFVTLFFLTDRPQQAKWLPAEEAGWLTEVLRVEGEDKAKAHRTRAWEALRQPQTLLLILIYFLIVSGNQGLIYFFPTITEAMQSMSLSMRTIVTVLPYVFGMAGIFFTGLSAHRTGEYRLHTVIPMMITGSALACAILAGEHLLLVISFFCLAGLTAQAYLPSFWTLPTAFLGKSAAAVAVGLINSFGSLGGFVGPYIFGYLRTETGSFKAGLWCLTGFTLLAGTISLALPGSRSTALRGARNQDGIHAQNQTARTS